MILIIIFLLVVLTICSILEVSFSSLNIIRIKKMADNKNEKAKLVCKLYDKYSETVTTILVINCIANVLVSSLTTYYFCNLIGDKYLVLVTIILTIIVLVFTEIIPKIISGYETTWIVKNKYSDLDESLSFFRNKLKDAKELLVEIEKE